MAIIGIKILRKIIEIENPSFNTPCVEWDTTDWIQYQKAICNRQNLLAELNAIDFLV